MNALLVWLGLPPFPFVLPSCNDENAPNWEQLEPLDEGGPSHSPQSPSDSLVAHASSESESDKECFFTPKTSDSSASGSYSASPGSDPRGTSQVLTEKELEELWQKQLVDAVYARLTEVDARGEIGKIPDGEIFETFKINREPRLTEMETLVERVRNSRWGGSRKFKENQ